MLYREAFTRLDYEFSYQVLPMKHCSVMAPMMTFLSWYPPKRTKQFAFPTNQKDYLKTADYVILYKRDSLLH